MFLRKCLLHPRRIYVYIYISSFIEIFTYIHNDKYILQKYDTNFSQKFRCGKQARINNKTKNENADFH